MEYTTIGDIQAVRQAETEDRIRKMSDQSTAVAVEVDSLTQCNVEQGATIMRLREALAKAREGLEPFAKAAYHAEDDEPDSNSLFSSSARHQITLGNLRGAPKVIAAIDEVMKGRNDDPQV